MTVLSMPALPDCVRCNGPVVLDIDGDGPREVCVKCGLSQQPITPADRGAIREAVRASRTRRLLGPSCLGRMHTRCTAARCECTCHPDQRPRRTE